MEADLAALRMVLTVTVNCSRRVASKETGPVLRAKQLCDA